VDLEALIAGAAAAPSVVVVPDRHGGGTNARLLAPPDVIQPSFGARSCDRHERLAHAAAACCRVAHVPTIALDVDNPDDLAALRGVAERITRARHTSLALEQLVSA
jgi:2-phospho-L-lactate guanylyltransferase